MTALFENSNSLHDCFSNEKLRLVRNAQLYKKRVKISLLRRSIEPFLLFFLTGIGHLIHHSRPQWDSKFFLSFLPHTTRAKKKEKKQCVMIDHTQTTMTQDGDDDAYSFPQMAFVQWGSHSYLWAPLGGEARQFPSWPIAPSTLSDFTWIQFGNSKKDFEFEKPQKLPALRKKTFFFRSKEKRQSSLDNSSGITGL